MTNFKKRVIPVLAMLCLLSMCLQAQTIETAFDAPINSIRATFLKIRQLTLLLSGIGSVILICYHVFKKDGHGNTGGNIVDTIGKICFVILAISFASYLFYK